MKTISNASSEGVGGRCVWGLKMSWKFVANNTNRPLKKVNQWTRPGVLKVWPRGRLQPPDSFCTAPDSDLRVLFALCVLCFMACCGSHVHHCHLDAAAGRPSLSVRK